MHRYIAAAISISGVIYVYGRQSHMLDDIFCRMSKAESETKDIHAILYDIHGRVCGIEKDIKNLVDTRK